MKSLIALVLLVACVAGAAACSSAPPPPPFKPVADTKLLMQAMIDPTADEIWDAVRTIVTEKGSEEIRPHTNAEWDAVRNHAVTLAEAGNLLMMVPRAKDGGEWMKRAQEMIDTSEKAIRAAEAKNADQLFTVAARSTTRARIATGSDMDAIVNANK